MIQRIQTIFLTGVAISMIIALFLPLATIAEGESIYSLTAFNLSSDTEVIADNFYISIPIVITAVVAVFSILQYKNRLMQIKLGALISMLVGISIVLIFFAKGDYQQVELGKGIWVLMFSLICNFFSNWFIRKDEKMVKDSNRLR